MTVKSPRRIARNRLVMAGVTGSVRSMFARRMASQTRSAIARRPASTPHPCHMLRPAEAIPANSTSCQLKMETMRNATVPPITSFAPCDSLEMSILRTFPFRGGRLTIALCNAM